MTGVLDVDRASVSKAADGSVLFDDPAAGWAVRIWTTTPDGGRPVIVRIRIDTSDASIPITPARWRRLPVAQMLHIAATTAATPGDDHANEVYYRIMARPLDVGQRSWSDDHWERVLAVRQWAVDTGRDGGGVRAVADLWGIAVRPTAYRWIAFAEARRRASQPTEAAA